MAPTVMPAATRSLCANIEAEGNNTTVKVGTDGRLYIGDLPVASALSSSGCRGNFAQAILAANMKLASIFMSSPARVRFQETLPSSNVKLGFLREILRGF
jgi:hypothetical protein